MKTLCIAAIVAFAASASQAATVSLDESMVPGGDFPGFGSPSQPSIGVFGAGTSTVTGALSGPCTDNDGFADCNVDTSEDTQDNFNFTIDNGFALSSLTFEATGSGPEGLAASFALGRYVSGSYESIEQKSVFVSGTGAFALSSGPLGAGTYVFFAFGNSAAQAGDFAYDWSMSANVEATEGGASVVPLPASLPILLAGLGAFGFLRRRKT